MARDAAAVQAEIDTLETRLTALADPDRVEGIKRGDRELRFRAAGDSETSIRRRLRELKAELARLTGGRSPAAPIKV
jgi:hypothetical protein